MTWPKVSYVVALAVLVTARAASRLAVTLALSEPLTGVPAGSVPAAVAVLAMEPRSRSAWLTVYVPVQLIAAPGLRLAGVTGVHSSAGSRGSATVTPARVVLPVLVTA